MTTSRVYVNVLLVILAAIVGYALPGLTGLIGPTTRPVAPAPLATLTPVISAAVTFTPVISPTLTLPPTAAPPMPTITLTVSPLVSPTAMVVTPTLTMTPTVATVLPATPTTLPPAPAPAATALPASPASVVPTAMPTAVPTPVPPPTKVPAPVATATMGPEIYVVHKGDTISSIASQFGRSPQAIIRVNGLTSPDQLKLGQKLIIPPP